MNAISRLLQKSGQNESRDDETRYVVPPVNIYETKDQIVVEAEMPGVEREGLEIHLKGDDLFLIGRRIRNETGGAGLWREISTHDFRRVFAIGKQVDRNSIHASFENGILTLKLAKADEVKPRRIDVEFR